MAKREVMMLYGEKTVQVNYRVPESKKDEIDVKIKGVLKEYENLQRVEIDVKESVAVKKNYDAITSKNYISQIHNVDELQDNIVTQDMSARTDKMLGKKSNPADVVVFTNPPTIEVEHYSDNAQLVQEVVPAAKSKPIADAKKEKVKALQEMADTIKNGSSGKSMSFISVKKPIDEIYDCIVVEKGIPAESDRIYYGTNNRIAFWDRDDSSVYYANWENKYYQFANSKEFHKFCKDNNIK